MSMRSLLEYVDHLWSLDTRTAEWLIGNMLFATGIGMLLTENGYYTELFTMAPMAFWEAIFLGNAVMIYISIIVRSEGSVMLHMRAFAIVISTVLFANMLVLQAQMGEEEGTAIYIAFAVSALYCFLNVMSKVPKKPKEVLVDD